MDVDQRDGTSDVEGCPWHCLLDANSSALSVLYLVLLHEVLFILLVCV